ncbi:hypothetical protein L596_024609 [Steinernema carpocapsae]|uniref:Uncharacterized protein n=1 Tax=Steinernema carpocapsae TaxID=34508 RepID=A0A4U5M580_STECR|nr:hypothetical protein L596_024609 [Steinernema carpocapsae]
MRASLVILPLAYLVFGRADNSQDDGSSQEELIYDDFSKKFPIRGGDNIVLSHTQAENVTNWITYFCGNVSQYRTAFREGINSSWTREQLEEFNIPELKLLYDRNQAKEFEKCKADLRKPYIDPVHAKLLRETVVQFCEDIDDHRQNALKTPSKTLKELGRFEIENLEFMDEKTIAKFEKCHADLEELAKITTTTSTIPLPTTSTEFPTTTRITATNAVPTSTEVSTAKTTSTAANTTALTKMSRTTTKTGTTSTFKKPAFWPWNDNYQPKESKNQVKLPIDNSKPATTTPKYVLGTVEISLLVLGSLLIVCCICATIVFICCICLAKDMPAPAVKETKPNVINYAPSYTLILSSETSVEPAEPTPNAPPNQAAPNTIPRAEIVNGAKPEQKDNLSNSVSV